MDKIIFLYRLFYFKNSIEEGNMHGKCNLYPRAKRREERRWTGERVGEVEGLAAKGGRDSKRM